MSKKILILFAHPALEKSRVNKQLIKEIEQLEFVTFHDLYQSYPEFDIEVEFEQRLLERHDVIIPHHPFYWYSTPAILKEWQDLVLEHGWAYGSRGNALKDKWMMHVITTGGREEAYAPDGYNGRTMRELLYPLEQTFKLCKMVCLPPFIVHGTHSIRRNDIEQHRLDLHRLLKAFGEDAVDLDQAMKLERINKDLDKIIKR